MREIEQGEFAGCEITARKDLPDFGLKKYERWVADLFPKSESGDLECSEPGCEIVEGQAFLHHGSWACLVHEIGLECIEMHCAAAGEPAHVYGSPNCDWDFDLDELAIVPKPPSA